MSHGGSMDRTATLLGAIFLGSGIAVSLVVRFCMGWLLILIGVLLLTYGFLIGSWLSSRGPREGGSVEMAENLQMGNSRFGKG